MEKYFQEQAKQVKLARELAIKSKLREFGVPNIHEWEVLENQFSTDALYEFKSSLGYTYRYQFFMDAQGCRFKLQKISKDGKRVLNTNVGDWDYMILTTARQLAEDE